MNWFILLQSYIIGIYRVSTTTTVILIRTFSISVIAGHGPTAYDRFFL